MLNAELPTLLCMLAWEVIVCHTGHQMAGRPCNIDDALQFIWQLPDSALRVEDKQRIVVMLIDQTEDQVLAYFSGPSPEMWLGALKMMLEQSGIMSPQLKESASSLKLCCDTSPLSAHSELQYSI